MFQNNFVVAIASNNAILREFKNEVYIPFNTEYSVVLNNLNIIDALVKVSIDGQIIASNLKVSAGQSIEIDRFQDSANKLKFVERSKEIEDFRGSTVNDGFLRVEFQFASTIPYPQPPTPLLYYPPGVRTFPSYPQSRFGANDSYCDSSQSPVAGITVQGSKSDQAPLQPSFMKLDEEKFVINLQMIGQVQYTKVNETITVKSKLKCSSCGTVSKSTAKFCSACGTSLIIFDK